MPRRALASQRANYVERFLRRPRRLGVTVSCNSPASVTMHGIGPAGGDVNRLP